MILAGALVLGLGVACGPKPTPATLPTGGSGSGDHHDGGGAVAQPGDGGDPGRGTAMAPLTRDECEQMIDHVLAIGMAAQRAQKPAEYVPTEAQVAAIRARLVADQLDECLTWSRPVWECTVAAQTVDALPHCAER